MAHSNVDNEAYKIGSTQHASVRLNLQYFLIAQQFGDRLLSPPIPSKIDIRMTPDLRIADICCGTGIWLSSLAREAHASTRLYAMDINLNTLPPDGFLPPNMTKQNYNVFDPAPPELVGTFDVVNVSLALSFIPDSKIDQVISNIVSFLKPEGWLQWTELEVGATKLHSPGSDSEAENLGKIVSGGWDVFGAAPPSWPRELEECFQRGGTIDSTQVLKPSIDLSMIRPWAEQLLLGADEVFAGAARILPDTPETKQKISDYQQIAHRAHAEYKSSGAGLWTPMIRVTGRKKP